MSIDIMKDKVNNNAENCNMIKQINKEQLPACLDIMKRAYENTAIKFGMTEENCPYRGRTRLPFQILEKEYNDGCLMYTYVYNNVSVGFLSLSVKEQEMHINDIVILPEYQNNGFGNKLMQFAIEKPKTLNCSKLVLGMVYDNIPLRNWYEKIGFHTTNLKKYSMVNYIVGRMEKAL